MPKKATELTLTQDYPLRPAQQAAFRALLDRVEQRMIERSEKFGIWRNHARNRPDFVIGASHGPSTRKAFEVITSVIEVWSENGVPNGSRIRFDEGIGATFEGAIYKNMNQLTMVKPWEWYSFNGAMALTRQDAEEATDLFTSQIFNDNYQNVLFAISICKWQARPWNANQFFPFLRFAFTRAFLLLFLDEDERESFDLTKAEIAKREAAVRRAERQRLKEEAKAAKGELAEDFTHHLESLAHSADAEIGFRSLVESHEVTGVFHDEADPATGPQADSPINSHETDSHEADYEPGFLRPNTND